MMLLAKMFGINPQGALGAKKHTAVRIPRLRILDLIELRQSGAKVTLSKQDEQMLESLSNFKKIEKIALPAQLQGTLRSYQEDGYRWLAFLYKNRFGACLADDMGLGKTIQIGKIKRDLILHQAL